MSVLTYSNSINFEVCHRVLSQSVYALLSLIQVILNRMIIFVMGAKIWYLKNVRFLLGHPVDCIWFTETLLLCNTLKLQKPWSNCCIFFAS